MNEAEELEVVKRAQRFVRFRRFFEAELLFRQLLALEPRVDWAHYLYGCFLLLQGDYDRGWGYFERRFGIPFYRDRQAGSLPGPRWAGEALPQGTLLLLADQGLGDTIMCARWLPEVCRRVGRVVVAVGPELRDLVQAVAPGIDVIVTGEIIPPYDVQAAVFSLPALLGCALETLPSAPYVTPDPQRVAAWHRHWGPADGRLRVGLAWQGSGLHPDDGGRSLPLARLIPILAVPGVRLIGLQPGDGAGQMERLPEFLRFDNVGPQLTASPQGMMETAACVATLDLVISVDTALVHLCGAVGAPCWVMLYETPDWRWLLDRCDSPWYPALRLFRQAEWGEWMPVIDRVAAALKQKAAIGTQLVHEQLAENQQCQRDVEANHPIVKAQNPPDI